MLIPAIAALGSSGLEDEDGLVEVSVIDFRIKSKPDRNGEEIRQVEWFEIYRTNLPRSSLAYNSTSDQSKAFVRTWQSWASTEKSSPPLKLKFGGNITDKGRSVFAGITKAAAYLMLSSHTEDWLKVALSESLNLDDFRRRREDLKTFLDGSKLREKWLANPKKGALADWILPVFAKSRDDRAVALGLMPNVKLSDESILYADVSARFAFDNIEFPTALSKLDNSMQGAEGVGRNVFGFKPKEAELPKDPSELARHFGLVFQVNRESFDLQRGQLATYRCQVGCNPTNAKLHFFPLSPLDWGEVRKFVGTVEAHRTAYYESLKRKSKEAESIHFDAPPLLPQPKRCRALLCTREGRTQPKSIVEQVFADIPLNYWSFLEDELLRGRLQHRVIEFGRLVRTGRLQAGKKDSPSVYALWTKLYTNALQREYINAYWFWSKLHTAFAALPTDALLGRGVGRFPQAAIYLDILRGLRRLQHLIGIAREHDIEEQRRSSIRQELDQAELNTTRRYAIMPDVELSQSLSPIEYVEPVWESLTDWQRKKLEKVASATLDGTPRGERGPFIRGVLSGLLLSELEYQLEKARRSFSATLGRHPSTMRDRAFTDPFVKGAGLAQNLKDFPIRFDWLPFIVGRRSESRRTSFNNGFIVGLSSRVKSDGTGNRGIQKGETANV